jgi:hypothetical protein
LFLYIKKDTNKVFVHRRCSFQTNALFFPMPEMVPVFHFSLVFVGLEADFPGGAGAIVAF